MRKIKGENIGKWHAHYTSTEREHGLKKNFPERNLIIYIKSFRIFHLL